MQSAIANKLDAFCDAVNRSKFLDWRWSIIDVIIIITFCIR